MRFDYDRFYWLGEGFTRSAIRVHAVETPKEPIRFRFDEGTRLYDFIGTTWAVLDIVSDRVIDALTENGFTGWTTYPVDIRSREDDPIHGYYGLAVTGRSGPIEDELSPIEILPPPVPQGEAMPHHMGLRFRPETWNGSDVFTPEGTTFAFVAKRSRRRSSRPRSRTSALRGSLG